MWPFIRRDLLSWRTHCPQTGMDNSLILMMLFIVSVPPKLEWSANFVIDEESFPTNTCIYNCICMMYLCDILCIIRTQYNRRDVALKSVRILSFVASESSLILSVYMIYNEANYNVRGCSSQSVCLLHCARKRHWHESALMIVMTSSNELSIALDIIITIFYNNDGNGFTSVGV